MRGKLLSTTRKVIQVNHSTTYHFQKLTPISSKPIGFNSHKVETWNKTWQHQHRHHFFKMLKSGRKEWVIKRHLTRWMDIIGTEKQCKVIWNRQLILLKLIKTCWFWKVECCQNSRYNLNQLWEMGKSNPWISLKQTYHLTVKCTQFIKTNLHKICHKLSPIIL